LRLPRDVVGVSGTGTGVDLTIGVYVTSGGGCATGVRFLGGRPRLRGAMATCVAVFLGVGVGDLERGAVGSGDSPVAWRTSWLMRLKAEDGRL
jgi:hypothetical protein